MEVKAILLEVSLMNFILGISKEFKWKVKVVLLELSLGKFNLWIPNEIKWKVKGALIKVSLMNFILQMEGKSGVTRSVIEELHSCHSQWDQMEAGSMVLLKVSSMNLILGMSKEIKWKVKVRLLEVSLMNLILGIYKEIKWKVKAWFYSKYHWWTSFLR